MGLVTTLIGNYSRSKMEEQAQKSAEIQQRIQADTALIKSDAPDDAKQFAQADITRLLYQHGGPEGRKHAPTIGTILGTLAGTMGEMAGRARPQQAPPPPPGPVPRSWKTEEELAAERKRLGQEETATLVDRTKAIETAKAEIDEALAEGNRVKARARAMSLRNILQPEEFRRMLVEIDTGVKLPAGRAVSQTEEFNEHALREKAREVGKFNAAGEPDPTKLTDAEYIDAITQAKEGTLGAPTYDPAKTPPTLTPGQRNEEILRGQPEGVVNLVKGLVNYAVPMPSSFALANPKSPWNKAMTLAMQYDPTFDASQYQVRLATKKDFTTGKAAQNLRSINTLVGHLTSLDRSAQALGNIPSGTYGPFTSLANMVRTMYRGASQEPKLKTFADDVNAVETELAAVFKGTGASDQEIKAWRSKIDASSSPEELKAHVLEAVNLMYSRLDYLKSQYENAMGRPFDMRFMSPENEQKLQQLTGGAPGSSAEPGTPGGGGGAGASGGTPGGVIEWERGPDGKPRRKQQ